MSRTSVLAEIIDALCASRRVLNLLTPVKFFHAQRVDTLIYASDGAGATTRGDRITCRVKLDVLRILHNVLVDIVVDARALLTLHAGTHHIG